MSRCFSCTWTLLYLLYIIYIPYIYGIWVWGCQDTCCTLSIRHNLLSCVSITLLLFSGSWWTSLLASQSSRFMNLLASDLFILSISSSWPSEILSHVIKQVKDRDGSHSLESASLHYHISLYIHDSAPLSHSRNCRGHAILCSSPGARPGWSNFTGIRKCHQPHSHPLPTINTPSKRGI